MLRFAWAARLRPAPAREQGRGLASARHAVFGGRLRRSVPPTSLRIPDLRLFFSMAAVPSEPRSARHPAASFGRRLGAPSCVRPGTEIRPTSPSASGPASRIRFPDPPLGEIRPKPRGLVRPSGENPGNRRTSGSPPSDHPLRTRPGTHPGAPPVRKRSLFGTPPRSPGHRELKHRSFGRRRSGAGDRGFAGAARNCGAADRGVADLRRSCGIAEPQTCGVVYSRKTATPARPSPSLHQEKA